VNTPQRVVIALGGFLVLAMCAYPPLSHANRIWRYGWIWDPGSIDTARLGLQCLLVAVATGLVAYVLRPTAIQAMASRKNICGDEFPEFCYRAFRSEGEARQFVSEGTFRMPCLLTFREGDEGRKDTTEGRGHILQPGTVTSVWFSPNPDDKTIVTREPGYREHHSEQGNPKFCLCTCLPEVDLGHMRRTFSQHIVRIGNPRQLAEDIHDYYVNKGVRVLIEGCRVVYNKGHKADRMLTRNERVDLAYKQKPDRFRRDCEFRFVVIKFGDPCPEACKYIGGEEAKCAFEECQRVALDRPLNYLRMEPE